LRLSSSQSIIFYIIPTFVDIKTLKNYLLLINMRLHLISSSSSFVGKSGGNGEFVLMDRGNWKFVDMDGSDGQVVTLGLESGIIGNPGQCKFLTFRGNPVGRSLVGVAHDFLVGGFAVRVVCDTLHLLLDLRFLAGSVVRSSVAIKQQDNG
jgi:hypothetical protein